MGVTSGTLEGCQGDQSRKCTGKALKQTKPSSACWPRLSFLQHLVRYQAPRSKVAHELHSKCLLNGYLQANTTFSVWCSAGRGAQGRSHPPETKKTGWGQEERGGVRSPGFLILCDIQSLYLSVTQFSHLANGKKKFLRGKLDKKVSLYLVEC